LFDQALDATQQRADAESAQSLTSAVDWNSMIRDLAAPYSLPGKRPDQAELTHCVDEAIGQSMRAILHHPYFRAVEAAWRGVALLTRRLETDANLKIYLLDVSKSELAADLFASDDLSRSLVHRRLVEETVHTPGGQPWALIVGQYTFDHTRADAELLGRMARIAHAAGAPMVAAAHDRHCGCESLASAPDPRDWTRKPDEEAAAAWTALKKLPEAAFVGLALPRIILRLPYGQKTNPIERFRFDEIPREPVHEQYLWGNPAIACGLLLGQSFAEDGWRLRPGERLEIDDLPLHVYYEDGEPGCYPCAECLLTDRAVEAICARGLMPLVSYRDSDKVRLAGCYSIAGTGRPLAGRWA
jgi:type VI secretion system protein ImpC